MLYIIFIIIFFIIIFFIVIFLLLKDRNRYEDYAIKESIKRAEEKEKILLQPIITSNDIPKIVLNGNGSFYSDEQITGKSYGSLALSDTERKLFAASGWHDTGLINGHGQPLVQNDKGEILSVCRSSNYQHTCSISSNAETKNWSLL